MLAGNCFLAKLMKFIRTVILQNCLDDYFFKISWFLTYAAHDDDQLFCGIVDGQKSAKPYSCCYNCRRFPSSKTSDMSQPEFEPAHNLDSDSVWWSCGVVIATKLRCHNACVPLFAWLNSFKYKVFMIILFKYPHPV